MGVPSGAFVGALQTPRTMIRFRRQQPRPNRTDREGDTLDLEADHRRHAEIQNAIRDLKYGVGLNHLPSGRFPANAAWLAVRVIAHNLAHWTTRIGLGEPVGTTTTLRRRFFSLAGRITRKARRITLHLLQGWPWQNQFQLRSGPIAHTAASFLTPPSAFDPSTMTPRIIYFIGIRSSPARSLIPRPVSDHRRGVPSVESGLGLRRARSNCRPLFLWHGPRPPERRMLSPCGE